jgi:hypothetical protein
MCMLQAEEGMMDAWYLRKRSLRIVAAENLYETGSLQISTGSRCWLMLVGAGYYTLAPGFLGWLAGWLHVECEPAHF